MKTKKSPALIAMLVASIIMVVCVVLSVILIFTVGLHIEELVKGDEESQSGGQALGEAILIIILVAYGFFYFFGFLALLIVTAVPGFLVYARGSDKCLVWARVMAIIDLFFVAFGIFWIIVIKGFELLTFITIIVETIATIIYLVSAFVIKRGDGLPKEIPLE